MTRWRKAGLAAVLTLGLAGPLGAAQKPAPARPEAPPRANVWDVKIGMTVAEIPSGDFIDISCGTNGGPPSLRLNGFADFAKCPPEPTGLHEVYFAYDDELEYWARANEYITWIDVYSGTKVLDQPVVLSVLLDDDGIVKGVRIVSDSRANPRFRREAIVLRKRFTSRFGDEGWACRDLPRAEGETPLRGQFIKQRCVKTYRGSLRIVLESHYLRKRGQTAADRRVGHPQEGYFESAVRLDMYDLSVPLENM